MSGKREFVLVGLIDGPKRSPVVDPQRLVNQPENGSLGSATTARRPDKETAIVQLNCERTYDSFDHMNEWHVMSRGDTVCLKKRDSA